MAVKFQEAVLSRVKQIPRGKVTTYGEIARAITGTVGAARAVGQAVARNPYPILIPCHRVVRSSGDLGGYCLGVAKKIGLLSAEGIEIIGGKVLNFEQVLFLFPERIIFDNRTQINADNQDFKYNV
jgi:methylated-DNA-[protein]-cysteine S-methyltransferase